MEEIVDINTLKDQIIDAIQNKKGKSITHLDLAGLENTSTDHYIICQGGSNTQVRAIADGIEKDVFEQLGERPQRKEGYQYQEWIILDYFNIVVHVFMPEKREFYKLEELWSDAKMTEYEDIL